MVAVITGDIVNSQKVDFQLWGKALEEVVGKDYANAQHWELYRGDEFQYLIPEPENAITIALRLKARIKMIADLDVRLSIGLGEIEQSYDKISQASGSALVNSGRNFEQLKENKSNLIIGCDFPEWNKDVNLLLEWLLLTADQWSATSAEMVYLFLSHPDLTQESAARRLKVSQPSISQALKRARYDLLLKTIVWLQNKISQLRK